MSGVQVQIFFFIGNDTRQLFKKVNFSEFFLKKYFKTKKPLEIIEYWTQSFPLEPNLLTQNPIQALFTSTTAHPNTVHLILFHRDIYFYFLHLKVNTGSLYFLQDFSLISTVSLNTRVITASCFYTYTNLNISTFSYVNASITSLSGLFRGFVWVEREVKEFSNCTFKGLLDTRRLLTDYLTRGEYSVDVYKTNQYDILSQNLYI